MNIKRDGDLICFRCRDPKRLHMGDELRCQRPINKKAGVGNGCFKSNYRYKHRVALSLNLDQADFIDHLLTLLTRGADISVLVRSDKFAGVKRIMSRSSQRARERRNGKEKAA